MFNTLGNSIPRNWLVWEWLLDGNALDTSWNWNNWTATNVTWVKTDKGYQSQAGSFNGSNSKIETSRTIPNNNNVTFSIWIYDTSANNTNWRIITADSWGWYFILQTNRPSPNNNWKASFNIFSWWDKQILETTAHNKNQWYPYPLGKVWDDIYQWRWYCSDALSYERRLKKKL